MVVISVLNRKGGTGKTTVSVNLATILGAAYNKRVLIIDMDGQHNASTVLRSYYKNKPSVYDVLTSEVNIKDTIINTTFENLNIIPSLDSLDDFITIAHNYSSPEFLLRNAIEQIENDYDYCIIDCPPGKSILTVNALTASGYVIIPMEAGRFALEGVKSMTMFVNDIRKKYNPVLEFAGILINKKERNSAQNGYETVIRNSLPYHVFNQSIRKSTIVEQSIANGEPLYYFKKYAPVTLDFTNVAKELIFLTKGDNNG